MTETMKSVSSAADTHDDVSMASSPTPDELATARDLVVAYQGDGTTGLPFAWDRVVPISGRVSMVTDAMVAGQSDEVGGTGFDFPGFWRCQ